MQLFSFPLSQSRTEKHGRAIHKMNDVRSQRAHTWRRKISTWNFCSMSKEKEGLRESPREELATKSQRFPGWLPGISAKRKRVLGRKGESLPRWLRFSRVSRTTCQITCMRVNWVMSNYVYDVAGYFRESHLIRDSLCLERSSDAFFNPYPGKQSPLNLEAAFLVH